MKSRKKSSTCGPTPSRRPNTARRDTGERREAADILPIPNTMKGLTRMREAVLPNGAASDGAVSAGVTGVGCGSGM